MTFTVLVFHLSVKCPKGFEPGILANGSSTCKPCPFGSYQKVAGKLEDNQPCVSCCDGLTESECTRNWTLSTGTERKSCFSKYFQAGT